jgi:hypothetical protein
MKAPCASSRARKLWSWVPGCENLRRVVKGATALVRVPRGAKAPWWGSFHAALARVAKPRSGFSGAGTPLNGVERQSLRTGPRAVKVLVGRDATGGRSATLAKPSPFGGGCGRSVRTWLARHLNTYFRIARERMRRGVGLYAAAQKAPGPHRITTRETTALTGVYHKPSVCSEGFTARAPSIRRALRSEAVRRRWSRPYPDAAS